MIRRTNLLRAGSLLAGGAAAGAPDCRGGAPEPRRRAGRSARLSTSKRSVRPVLAANCYDCHADERMGGLRLDSREGLLKGGKSGPAIVPGDPEKSLMIQAVRQTRDTLKMPKGGRLKPAEIDALVEWVKAGAPGPPSRAGSATTADARGRFGGQACAGAASAIACVRDQAGAARLLVVPAAARDAGAGRVARVVGEDRHRSLRARAARAGRARAGARRRQAHAAAARHARPDGPAADAGRDRRLRAGRLA